MAETGRAKMGALFSIVFLMFILLVLMGYSLYIANVRKPREMRAGGNAAINTNLKSSSSDITPNDEYYPQKKSRKTTEPDESLLPFIERVRASLARYLTSGIETGKFSSTFESLEEAAIDGRIDKERLTNFPDALRISLVDGNIDEREMDAILDLLESSVIE